MHVASREAGGSWHRAATIGALLLAAACTATGRTSAATATAEIKNVQGQVVGTAILTEVSGGVQIVVTVSGLPPGDKAVHIHEIGRCNPPAFASAGNHFNPDRKRHGLKNPAGPHAGDLPNLRVDPDGTGRLEAHNDRVTLGGGGTSLLDSDGSALVIHGAPDDHRTDPTGNSGARLACGVLVREPAARR
jgi:Cu-Zn family superoxide dismutase